MEKWGKRKGGIEEYVFFYSTLTGYHFSSNFKTFEYIKDKIAVLKRQSMKTTSMKTSSPRKVNIDIK